MGGWLDGLSKSKADSIRIRGWIGTELGENKDDHISWISIYLLQCNLSFSYDFCSAFSYVSQFRAVFLLGFGSQTCFEG